MFNVTTEQKPNGIMAVMSGAFDDSVSLDKLIANPPNPLHINCAGVNRINSVGVKAWIQYFDTLRMRGTKVELHECSPVIVEQLNLVVNFHCGAKINSVQVPYSCPGCKNQFVQSFGVESLKKNQYQIPAQKCPKCGTAGSFDDFPEEYFEFLMRD
jgi:hypothetical protein